MMKTKVFALTAAAFALLATSAAAATKLVETGCSETASRYGRM
jgi:hypothetical protein